MKENLPVIVIGAGGHAKVLIDILLSLSIKVLGMTDPDPEKSPSSILNIPVIGNEDIISKYATNEIRLVIGFGSIRVTSARERAYLFFKGKGHTFANVIHPSSVIASEVHLGEGVQIMAGTVIQPGCNIGSNTIVNTCTSIDHDCKVGDHVHLAPGVTLSGNVIIGKRTHVGTGATVIQKIQIGRDSLIAAGSLIIRDIPNNVTAMGVPAKVVENTL